MIEHRSGIVSSNLPTPLRWKSDVVNQQIWSKNEKQRKTIEVQKSMDSRLWR